MHYVALVLLHWPLFVSSPWIATLSAHRGPPSASNCGLFCQSLKLCTCLKGKHAPLRNSSCNGDSVHPSRAFHSWAARSTWSPHYNFAAVDFEMSPLVVIAFCVPSCASKVLRSVVTCPHFFLPFVINFDGMCDEYAIKVIVGNRSIYW